jgi:uncharacterized protein (DUF362 family)/Pyruvate/2-oxoacid:ferredoxin oxidoreductase delta subunit
VLRAVVERLEAMGPAAIVVGDNPGVVSYGANETTFQHSGLMDAARGHYRNIGNDAMEVDFNPEFAARVSISRAVRAADVLISLPKFKTHGLTAVTGAIKNSYGYLPGAQKARLHRLAGNAERFNELIVDVFRLRVPDLFIVDAVMGMEGNGPACSDLRHIGRILASDNGVALDAAISRMMGLDPGSLRFLRKATEWGLGSYEAQEIEIIGELTPIQDFKLPTLGGATVAGNPAIQEAMHQRTLMRPKAKPELCTGCGTCVDQCPVSALSLEGDFPVVNPEVCIACFCCQEVCPEKAMALA